MSDFKSDITTLDDTFGSGSSLMGNPRTASTEFMPNNEENKEDIPLNQTLGIPLSNTSSTTSGSTDFVKKLFLMLEDNSYSRIVRWTDKGDSFVVIDNNEFTKEILPKHFKHSNFASFVRQLNKYDFHKVKQSNEEKQSNEYGEGAWEFKHNDFRRHDREALETIKRKGPTQKRTNINSEETCSNASEAVKRLEQRFDMMQQSNDALVNELKTLNHKYTNVLNSFISLKTLNDSLVMSMNTLVQGLLNQGIKVPQLNLPVITPNDQQHLYQQPLPPAPQQYQQVQQQLNTNMLDPQHQTSQPSSAQSSSNPTRQQPQLSQQATQSASPVSTNLKPGFHVLLVEDEPVSIRLCTKFLEKCGCSVEIVTDGYNAITALEKDKYDLVLMDIVMPNLDGATATACVREFNNFTPIIAMTGNVDNEDLYTYLQTGMNDVLAKPFSQKDLQAMLEKHLGGKIPLSQQQRDRDGQQTLGNRAPDQLHQQLQYDDNGGDQKRQKL